MARSFKFTDDDFPPGHRHHGSFREYMERERRIYGGHQERLVCETLAEVKPGSNVFHGRAARVNLIGCRIITARFKPGSSWEDRA